ncbi:DUF2852 domain-containing protein [Vannielia litorea]|uniref:DUF2852 domain-containing protein n=1 Tax=Vannielia litorea TaxID=1217970 RepID=UPI001C971C3C|nr:DUF2852 domain-containing protein [Vannielia litorea]MBY6047166.1 DUF2852 domain-containing protein [Vannielia litorea]MBY6074580.1 DUF2852 domain-containing protein [Vannielia litorea]MBY6152901.1 DUF2852 domain-containing protein [Vannielia litorea]
MNTAQTATVTHQPGWFARAEGWLDERGKGAWIAAMVLGFIFFWPVGLALLAYMIWSKRMFSGKCAVRRSHHHEAHRMNRRHGFRSSGNTAFDAYKAETLRRLEDEQDAFESFLERLRAAKDKQEFDAFMDDRAKAAQTSDDEDDDTGAEPALSEPR